MKTKILYFNILIMFFIAIIILNCCISLNNFFPIDHFYYPVFCNGYKNEIIVYIKYAVEPVIAGKFIIKTGIKFFQREEGFKIELIKIYDTDNNQIADYPKEYLNSERQQKGNPENELWVAYEGGLILVPEEYHHGDDWQKYIESIKKEES